MTLDSLGRSGSTAGLAGASSAFATAYFTIFLSMMMRAMVSASEFSVVARLEGIEQVRRGVHFAVVLYFFVAFGFDGCAVLQREPIRGVLQILLFDEHPLKRFWVEAERGAAFQALLVCVEIDVLEVLVRIVGGHVGRLRDRGVDPFLRGRLDIDVLARGNVLGAHEIVGQTLAGLRRIRHRAWIYERAIGQ